MSDLLTRSSKKKITASDIRAGMKKRWCDPQWAVMWEVNEGTGHRTGRAADAVMMSLWPSRGLELHGVEIKVNRSDWKREALDPSKAEAIAKYCDRWWIHTSPGIVDDLSDLPPAWGLREFDGRNWATIREAEKTEAAAINRAFLAALLRRADGAMQEFMNDAMREAREAQYAAAEKVRQDIRNQIEEGIKRRTEKLCRGQENVSKFEAAFGEGAALSWDCQPEAWGKAARALAKVGSRHAYNSLADRLRKAADEIDALSKMVNGDDE